MPAVHVSTDSKLRDASSEADEKLRKFGVDFGYLLFFFFVTLEPRVE